MVEVIGGDVDESEIGSKFNLTIEKKSEPITTKISFPIKIGFKEMSIPGIKPEAL